MLDIVNRQQVKRVRSHLLQDTQLMTCSCCHSIYLAHSDQFCGQGDSQDVVDDDSTMVTALNIKDR